LVLTIVRNQTAIQLETTDAAFVVVEASSEADALSQLVLPKSPSGTVTTNRSTKNDPVSVLTDGQLDDGYGPVFGNGITAGLYRMDLGVSKSVSAITSWSTNKGDRRGPQKLALFGSNATEDPGWRLDNESTFTPIGNIDTTSSKPSKFNAASLRSRPGKSLGTFRWIYWQVHPVTELNENTAFQELHVETSATAATKMERQ
jgi:hypothetical protein